MTTIRKAAKPAVVAVYDENGKLVGTVDPDAISPVGSAGGAAARDAKVAPGKQSRTQDSGGAEAASAQDGVASVITKALVGVQFRVTGPGTTTVDVLRGAANLDDQFERLCKSVDQSTADRLHAAVAAGALRIAAARRVSSSTAVRLAKRAAIEAGFAAVRKASTTDRGVRAEIEARIAKRRVAQSL